MGEIADAAAKYEREDVERVADEIIALFDACVPSAWGPSLDYDRDAIIAIIRADRRHAAEVRGCVKHFWRYRPALGGCCRECDSESIATQESSET